LKWPAKINSEPDIAAEKMLILLFIVLGLLHGGSSRAVRQSLRAREGECFNYCRDRVLGVGVQVRELKDVNDIRRAWRAAVHTAATTGAGKTESDGH
jgi:hypothetical protein